MAGEPSVSLWAIGPFLVAFAAAYLGPRVLRSLPPRTAVRLGTALALVVALTTGLVLAVCAELAVTQLQAIATGRDTPSWEPSAGPLVVGIVAGGVVVLLLLSSTRSLTKSVRNLYLAWRDTRLLNPTGQRVVVVQDEAPAAFAVTGYPGQVVVSSAMLQALEPQEQAALLAHEDAHLRYHHQVYVQLTTLAAAANPLLRPFVDIIGTATERWADEEAAAAVGDRALAARAVARAALATHRHRPHLAPAVSRVQGSAQESQLSARLSGLLEPAPHLAKRAVVAVLMAVSLCCATGGMAAIVGHQQVEHIEMLVLETGR